MSSVSTEPWSDRPSWYEEHDVDARFGTKAVADRRPWPRGGARRRGATALRPLLVSTGGRNRRLEVPGAGLPGVFDLRYHRDAVRIREAATAGARVVCVGMGFIGAEVAASLRTIGCDVTVVEIFETTLYRILGPEIGRVLEGDPSRPRGDDALQRLGRAVRGRRQARARRHRGRRRRSTPTSR